jgi:ATP-dependent Clp protease ATP-binding subunit ClpA/post-segregation antitoxin (ccd killing protein)
MMPKINVYLPDDLADAVKNAGVPVSAICQRALETAVKRMTAIRGAVLREAGEHATDRLQNFTPRARGVLSAATQRARDTGAPGVGTEHLLAALIEEGQNLGVEVLATMEIDPAAVTTALTAQPTPAPQPPAELHFNGEVASALELAVIEAVGLGHNYIGCEHLLLGLVAESDGTAGRVLRELGADPRQTRRAVSAACAGYAHLLAQQTTPATSSAAPGAAEGQAGIKAALNAAIQAGLRPLTERIDRLEARLPDN